MEANVPAPSRKLNEMQLTLLKSFDRGMTDEQIVNLKQTLVAHYSVLLAQEVERACEEKGYADADFERMLNSPS